MIVLKIFLFLPAKTHLISHYCIQISFYTVFRAALNDVFDIVKVVDVLDSKDEAHLALMKRPELGVTFTKLHCWTLTQFKKCVFMDADMLVSESVCTRYLNREFSIEKYISQFSAVKWLWSAQIQVQFIDTWPIRKLALSCSSVITAQYLVDIQSARTIMCYQDPICHQFLL